MKTISNGFSAFWLTPTTARPHGIVPFVGVGIVSAMSTATGTFEIEMTPAASEISDAVGRFNFTKTFRGDLDATGTGIMLSAGTPQSGEAGYVAIETVQGRLNGLVGGFALQQFGTMHDGSQTLEYVVVPGSGSGSLDGITGTLHLTVEDDGIHHYKLDFEI